MSTKNKRARGEFYNARKPQLLQSDPRTGHVWMETSDPLTPMCVKCKTFDGDPAADKACPR